MCDEENISNWHESEMDPYLVGSISHFHSHEIIETWNHDFQHLQISLTMTASSKKFNPLESRTHHTVTPGTLMAFFFL